GRGPWRQPRYHGSTRTNPETLPCDRRLDSPVELDQSPLLLPHLAFIEDLFTATLGGFPPFLERWISGWLRVLPLALAILPVSVIAERCQIARRVVSNRVHPSSLPSLAEDPLVNPALQMIPEEGWITGMLLFLVRNELQETPAAFLNRLAQPLGEISLRTLDGTRPQREGFPLHVFFADRVQLRPRYV